MYIYSLPIGIALSFLFSIPAFCQQPFSSKADSLREAGHIDLALAEYATYYRANPTDFENIRAYAETLALNGDLDSAFWYLDLIIGQDSSVSILIDPDFYTLIEDERWKKVQETLVRNVESMYGPYPRPELSKRLWTVYLKDQAFYYHLQVVDKRPDYEYFMGRALWDLKHKLKEENLRELDAIVTAHGWPKTSEVRGAAAMAAFLVVQHADLATQRKYLPLMQAAAESGEAEWSNLALLIDRVNLAEGKPQIYGSQVKCDYEGKCYIPNLKDPAYVNQRREEVGLGPIEAYAASWGIEWEVAQKKR